MPPSNWDEVSARRVRQTPPRMLRLPLRCGYIAEREAQGPGWGVASVLSVARVSGVAIAWHRSLESFDEQKAVKLMVSEPLCDALSRLPPLCRCLVPVRGRHVSRHGKGKSPSSSDVIVLHVPLMHMLQLPQVCKLVTRESYFSRKMGFITVKCLSLQCMLHGTAFEGVPIKHVS